MILLEQKIVFPFADTPALCAACRHLAQHGILIADQPTPDVTHLLLSVPSFDADGSLRGGGDFLKLRSCLTDDVTIVGGNLTHSLLEKERKLDLLENPYYIARNAALTADGAMRLAAQKLQVSFLECPMLIIGWGRIGKCLAKLLQNMGAQVWVAVRKEQDQAMLEALGYRSLFIHQIHTMIAHWSVIFNTAPAPVLTQKELRLCRKDCVKIDLASQRGMEGEDILWFRGIPGKMLPESSGRLIAECILRKERIT